jgi:hypothetical protein
VRREFSVTRSSSVTSTPSGILGSTTREARGAGRASGRDERERSDERLACDEDRELDELLPEPHDVPDPPDAPRDPPDPPAELRGGPPLDCLSLIDSPSRPGQPIDVCTAAVPPWASGPYLRPGQPGAANSPTRAGTTPQGAQQETEIPRRPCPRHTA